MKQMTFRLVVLLALVLAATLTMGTPAIAQSVKGAAKDAATTARVETMFLLNDQLSPFDINTTTSQGVVTLTGSVDEQVARELAEDLARSAKGVTDVVNHIQVVPAVQGTNASRGFRQSVRDKTTTAAIRSRLLYHKQFGGLNINVKTENGEVMLAGVVASEEQKRLIGQIAFETKGVKSVSNDLTINSKTELAPMAGVGRDISDEWIEKRVETALLMNRHIAVSDLNIEVNDGLVILAGTADSDVQKNLAESITKSIQGVGQVENDIKVKVPTIELEPLEPEE